MTTPPGTGRDSAGRADVRAAAESIGHRGHAVFALDAAGRLTYWNPQAAALSGWSPETALGRPLYDLLVGRSRLELGEGLDLLAAGRAWVADLDVEGPRGKAVRVEVWAEPVRAGGAGGPVCGSVAVLRSLSAGQAEHRLHELTAVLRTVPDAVVVVDDKGLVRDWNPAAERMFGWSRGEVLGSHVERLVPETERLAFHAVWERLVAGVEVPAYEARRQGPDGETRLVGVHAAAFREKGSFAGAVATFRELSPRQQEDRLLADLVAGIPVVVAAYDGQGRVTVGAGGGYLRAGVAPALAHGTDLLAVLPDGSPLHVAVTASLRGAESQLQVQFDDRVWQCHVGTLPEGGFVSAVDVTGEQVMGDRMRALLAAAPLAFVTFDASARITYAAGSSFAAMNVDPQDLVGLRLLDVWGDDPQISEAVVRCLTGVHVDLVVEYAERVWDLHYRCYRDARGTVTGGVCMAQDATGWVVARTDEPTTPLQPLQPVVPGPLRGLLERDELTGLPGRRGLQRRLDAPLPDGLTRVVAVLDADEFSHVRDTYGRDASDLVLQVLAGRLLSHVQPALVGRWESDRFVLVLDAPDAQRRLDALLVRATAAAAEPVVLPDAALHLSTSVGAASSDEVPLGELLSAAEQALQRGRADGTTEVRWYSTAMRPVLGGARLVRELREAIAGGQLRLAFQPLVSLSGRRPVGVEALVRWEHPREGLLLPGAFIPLAERTGLVHDLGRWVAQESCRQAVRLAAEGTALRVSLNVSARQLVEPGLVRMLREAMAETGCPAGALTVEVTETAVMADLDVAVATLTELKELGVELALDDFGTGWSSLLYLQRFPVDVLKIDRSFVSGLGVSDDATAIVASTISLGHSVGVRCVAEGVETVDQLELLDSMGCDIAQGYLFSRALSAEHLGRWLAEHGVSTPRRGRREPSTPPPEAAEILRLHAEGASLHTIAAVLNLAGHRTARGVRWRAQSVAGVVARWAYPSLGLEDET